MNESIGRQLRAARQARGLSLEQVYKETHIKPHYLEALEADAWERLPSRFQGRGFLRVYGGFLGLDSEALLRQLDEQSITPASSAVPPVQAASPSPPAQPSAAPASTAEQQKTAPQAEQAEPLQDAVSSGLPAANAPDAQVIFQQIGAELRRIRTHLGLSVEEVEQQTHLRAHHIQILEAGAFDRLASPVQGRGLLQIYASFLGLNTDAVLLRYADALQAQLAARQGNRPQRRRAAVKPPSGKSWSWLWSAEFLAMTVLSLATFAFIVWGFANVMRTRASLPPTPTPFSVAEALLAIEEQPLVTATELSPTPTTTPTFPPEILTVNPGGGETELLTQTLLPSPVGKVQVILSAQQRAWLRVLVDGKELYNGRIQPGSVLEYNGEEKIELQTGNAAAIKVIYNQQDLGVLGGVGEVLTQIFTAQGVLQPTATITPTATRTLRPSPTPRPTQTPRPTRTPLPTATSSPIPTP